MGSPTITPLSLPSALSLSFSPSWALALARAHALSLSLSLGRALSLGPGGRARGGGRLHGLGRHARRHLRLPGPPRRRRRDQPHPGAPLAHCQPHPGAPLAHCQPRRRWPCRNARFPSYLPFFVLKKNCLSSLRKRPTPGQCIHHEESRRDFSIVNSASLKHFGVNLLERRLCVHVRKQHLLTAPPHRAGWVGCGLPLLAASGSPFAGGLARLWGRPRPGRAHARSLVHQTRPVPVRPPPRRGGLRRRRRGPEALRRTPPSPPLPTLAFLCTSRRGVVAYAGGTVALGPGGRWRGPKWERPVTEWGSAFSVCGS